MGLGEHILDLLTGPDIPVRYAVRLHILLELRPLLAFALRNGSFPDPLHDGEGLLAVHPLIDQIGHDIVTGTDRRRDCRLPALNQFLGVVKPHVRSMGQPRDTD